MDKKVKIAFLNIYQEKVSRGVETYITELSKRLKEYCDVDIISNINYFKIFRNGYDVIVPTNGRLQALIVRLITWLSGSKMVVSGQSGLGADDKWNLVCMPDFFVALSSYAQRWAKSFNPLVRVEYIPNGVDLEQFNPNVKPMNVGLPHPIVLSVAALEEGKRLDLIIKAVAKTGASLLLVGKGSKEEELKELGNNIMPGRFKIMSVAHFEIQKVYTACDVFTYSTLPWESFGIAMLEAMASSLPVVATSDPIRKEIVGDAGFLIDPTKTDEYAKTLQKALTKKWGNIPRNQAEKFNWDDISKKYLKLFNELL